MMDETAKVFLIGACLTILGIWSLLRGLRQRSNAQNTTPLRWAAAEGQVLEVKLNPERLSETLTQTVTFSYAIEGHTYQAQESSAILPVGWLEPQTWKASLSSGSRVQVFYDRQNPRLATLKNAAPRFSTSVLITILCFGNAALSWVVLLARLV